MDEFLFSPTGRPVPEILRDYEEHPGVGVNCVEFGTSGHQTPPPGLVIENYTRRLGLERPRNAGRQGHRRPERAVSRRATAPTTSSTRTGRRRWTSCGEPVRGDAETVSVERLRINHYFTRSQEERERKLAAPRVDNGRLKKPEGVEERDRRLNEEADETILMLRRPRCARRSASTTQPAHPAEPG